jgi:protein O-GlcNAc transferase
LLQGFAFGCSRMKQPQPVQRIFFMPTFMSLSETLTQAIQLLAQGQPEQAWALCHQAQETTPEHPDVLHLLGVIRGQQNAPAEGLVYIQRAIAQGPKVWPEAHTNLARLAHANGDYTLAESAYLEALRQNPDHPDLLFEMGLFFRDAGHLNRAQAWFERILEREPEHAAAMALFLDTLPLCSDRSDKQRATQVTAWAQQYLDPLTPAYLMHFNPPVLDRRLRVAYLGGEIAELLADSRVVALWRDYNREAFELSVWASGADQAPQLQTWGVQGVDPGERSSQELATLVRSQQVDIAVDLCGVGLGHLLPVLAQRPAPVQLSGLRNAMTTGMAAIDGFFSHALTTPVDAEPLHREALLHVASPFYWEPSDVLRDAPLGPLPLATQGYLTIGVPGDIEQINEHYLTVLTLLQQRLPDSVLYFSRDCFAEPGLAQWLSSQLQTRNISASQIRFGAGEGLSGAARYQPMDFALLSFPYPDLAEAMNCLYMGVPCLTAITDGTQQAQALLKTVGLEYWVAPKLRQLVEHSQGLYTLEYLQALRPILRSQLQASPIMDQSRWLQNIEGAYRYLWQDWCKNNAGFGGF